MFVCVQKRQRRLIVGGTQHSMAKLAIPVMFAARYPVQLCIFGYKNVSFCLIKHVELRYIVILLSMHGNRM